MLWACTDWIINWQACSATATVVSTGAALFLGMRPERLRRKKEKQDRKRLIPRILNESEKAIEWFNDAKEKIQRSLAARLSDAPSALASLQCPYKSDMRKL